MTKRDKWAYWAAMTILMASILIAMSIEGASSWDRRFVEFLYGSAAWVGYEELRDRPEGE